MPLIVESVSKTYRGTTVVEDTSFVVDEGTLCGIVGTNGAGKTTLLRIVSGLIEPTTGRAMISGADTLTPAGRARIGVVPDIPELVENVSGIELLTHIGIMRGLTRDEARRRAREVSQFVGVPTDPRPISVYSTGNRKRVAIAAAEIVIPNAQILDEPLEAIDPLASERICTSWRGFCDKGGLVLLSTHDLRLAADICDRILVMANGAIVADLNGPRTAADLLDILRAHDRIPA